MSITLESVISPKKASILIIGAHPDDFEIMAGGTLARWKSEGGKTYAMVMSDGELGGNPNARRAETKDAANVLGIKEVFFCGLPDCKIEHEIGAIHLIEKKVKELKPSIIITHDPNDTHQDHKNVGLSCISAARRHPRILFGETPSSVSHGRSISIDITNFINLKMKALKKHKTQCYRLGESLLLKQLEALAVYRGSEVGVKYAEAFWVWRLLLGGNK
jgi:LmbE family N-acetylglucosaminyl deacetylase